MIAGNEALASSARSLEIIEKRFKMNFISEGKDQTQSFPSVGLDSKIGTFEQLTNFGPVLHQTKKKQEFKR